MTKRNPWVITPQPTEEEIEAEIQSFLKNGGEIIKIDDSYNSTKTNSDTAVKIGKVHRQLAECAKKKS